MSAAKTGRAGKCEAAPFPGGLPEEKMHYRQKNTPKNRKMDLKRRGLSCGPYSKLAFWMTTIGAGWLFPGVDKHVPPQLRREELLHAKWNPLRVPA